MCAFVLFSAFFFLLLSLHIIPGVIHSGMFSAPFDFLVSLRRRKRREGGATAAALLSESAAEESRDAPFLRFSSFPPFIRAPVVVPRLLVSWFLLCHTRPYIHTPRVFFLHTGLRVRLGYIMPG